MALFIGKQKITFCKKLDADWPKLADYFEIDEEIRNRFTKGEEQRGIWAWLEAREKLNLLYEALTYIDRNDLVVGMKEAVWVFGWCVRPPSSEPLNTDCRVSGKKIKFS